MEDIVLRYTTSDGNQERIQVSPEKTSVVFYSRDIVDIDLSGIDRYTEMEELDLRRNRLAQIDLAPLQHCPNLKSLRLSGNQLTRIDLAPL